MFGPKKQLTEEELAKKRRAVKNSLFVMASPVLALPPAIGAGLGQEAFLGLTNKAYPAANTPAGVDLTNSVINAHMDATGLNYPDIVSTSDTNLPNHLQQGSYIPRYAARFLTKTGLATGLSPEGTVFQNPTGNTFILAHELGHRAQDYHPIAGPSQTIAPLLGHQSHINALAVAAVSAKAQTNRGALAKGLLTSYALSAPQIASEVVASRLGAQYLQNSGAKTAAVAGPASMLQPIGYALAPAAAAIAPIAVGRIARNVSQRWKDRKQKKEQQQQAQAADQNIVY